MPILKKTVSNEKNLLNINKKTILFVDEIHRFSKSQQDYLLQHIEDGTITLIGATTENPSFELIAPLVSRTTVYVFNTLNEKDLLLLLNKAIKFLQDNKILIKFNAESKKF